MLWSHFTYKQSFHFSNVFHALIRNGLTLRILISLNTEYLNSECTIYMCILCLRYIGV